MADPDGRNDLGRVRLLDAAAVDALPWEPLEGRPGVAHKILWQSGATVLGLMRIEPGATEPGHAHLGAHHHLWLVEGSATVCGTPLSAGSYAYIPPGTEHETTDVGPEGCTFFYTYRPLDTEHGARPHDVAEHGHPV
jgi:mannose-6-phosphate isomerase-like protein (cupin superfamily)